MELKNKKICILYNEPKESDLPDRASVMDEVNLVKDTLLNLSCEVFLLPVDRKLEWIDILKKKGFDVVINLCEDFEGKPEGESWVAGILETLEIPYTGSPPESFSLCLDKVKAKILVSHYGIKTPKFFVIGEEDKIFFPLILKPRKSDSSLFIEKKNVIFNEKDYKRRIRELEKYNVPFFAEEYIDGREFNVSIFDDRVIGIGEVIFKTEPRILTYSSKWDKNSEDYVLTPVIYPAELDKKKEKEIENISLKIFNILEMRDYGRIDLRMDFKGEIFFIEANPNPDISRDSGFYKALEFRGISYSHFIERLIERACERRKL
ncbi:MAG: hypothetical protein ABIN20_08095 [candidate division WOR-3 bacterium]